MSTPEATPSEAPVGDVTPAPATPSVLHHREFRLLWLAQVISSFGDSLTGLTLLILVNELTGSTAAIATLTVLMAIPTVTLGLIAGVYVDRFDRKRIMLASDALRALLVVGLIFADSKEHLWVLFALSFAQAAVGTFFNPARGALVQQLVPEHLLLQAGSLSQTSMVLANLAGASFAGVLYGLTKSFWVAFTVDAASFLLSFALVLAVRAGPPGRGATATRNTGVLSELLEGLRYTARNRVLLAILVAGGITMLGFGAVNVLFVPLVVNVFKVPPVWLGAVEGAETVGMVLSGVLLAGFASRINPKTLIVAALGLLTVLTVGIGLASNVFVFALILAGFGIVVVPLNASAGALLQQHASNEVMGRVGSTFGTITGLASLVSMGFAGWLATGIGIQNVFLIASALVAAATVCCAVMFRAATGVAAHAVDSAA